VLLVGFVYAERRSRAPMLRLSLFQSRTFGAVNLLTLLLYAAVGGVFFFLPFALIQVLASFRSAPLNRRRRSTAPSQQNQSPRIQVATPNR
jgi:hypothetical protein